VPLTSLTPGGLFGHDGVGALLVIALLGYVGFEAAAVFSEEARAPRRTVPVAVYTSLALIGAIYALSSWAMSVHYGDDQVAAVAAEQGPGMLFAMSGPVVAEIATWLFITSLFAAMISFHNAVARYMFALGRERVLPAALGRTESRTGAPRIASLTQSAIGLAVIVVYALAGWDPMVQLFFWLGTSGAFGVLCLLATTSIAVITFFARDPRGENAWRRLSPRPWPRSPCWPWSGPGWPTTPPCSAWPRARPRPGPSPPHSPAPAPSASGTGYGCVPRARASTGASGWAPTPEGDHGSA
jgi:amino acid transporter